MLRHRVLVMVDQCVCQEKREVGGSKAGIRKERGYCVLC